MNHAHTAAILVAAGTVTIAACSASSTRTPSATTASATIAASSPATPTSAASSPFATPSKTSHPHATSTRAADTTTASTQHTTACREAQLRATIDPRDVPGNGTNDSKGRRQRGVIVDFQNTSATSCDLSGYPGAATVDAAGDQVIQATRTPRGSLDGLPAGSDTIPVVTLTPGHYADAMIEGVDRQKPGAAQAGCAADAPSILVTPPNTRIAVPFRVSWPACDSFDIHPVMTLIDAP